MRGVRGTGALVGLGLVLAACSGSGEPASSAGATRTAAVSPGAGTSPTAESGSGDAASPGLVVVFAGDIANDVRGTPSYANARATAALVRRTDPTYVLTGGDNAYPSGRLADFRTKYAPTWGVFKGRTKPVPGNHEYQTRGATGYYAYFFGGKATGHRYYAFGAGQGWRVYALNCEIRCGDGSTQERWLRRDLARHPGLHYLVTVHRPRYTSGHHLPYRGLNAIWRDVMRAGGDLVLSGHNHQYERFPKQDAAGRWKPHHGMVQFVAGAGGATLYPFTRKAARSQVRNAHDYGVLVLHLHSGSYSWQFVASGRCFRGGRSYGCPARTGRVLDKGTRQTNNPA